MATFAIPFHGKFFWEFSSVGLEHLPYKQRVGGSNPSTPTRHIKKSGSFESDFFVFVPGLDDLEVKSLKIAVT